MESAFISESRERLRAALWGCGTAALGGIPYENSSSNVVVLSKAVDTAYETLEAASRLGDKGNIDDDTYKVLIDTAPWYLDAELVTGRAITRLQQKYGRERVRERIVIATKLGRYRDASLVHGRFDYSEDTMRSSLKKSLQFLGVDFIDVLFLHDVEFMMNDAAERQTLIDVTLPSLIRIREETQAFGLIGICGYPIEALEWLVMNSKPGNIDVVQTYCHLTLQSNRRLEGALPNLVQRCDHGIIVTVAAPLSMGLLTHASPPHWHPAPRDMIESCHNAFKDVIDIATIAIQFTFQRAFNHMLIPVLGCVGRHQADNAVALALRVHNGQQEDGDDIAKIDTIQNRMGEWRDYAWASGPYKGGYWNDNNQPQA